MVQDALVAYVSSQLALGVSRDEVRSALLGAGWAAGDVDDTLKKVEGGSGAKPAAGPVSMGPAATAQSAKIFPTTIGAAQGNAAKGGAPNGPAPAGGAPAGEPRTIRVSDLISAGAAAAPAGKAVGNIMDKAVAREKEKGVSGGMNMKTKSGWGGRIMLIVGIVLVLGLGGLAGYLYFQNSGLAAKVASLSGESAGVVSQVAGLQSQVAALDASNTALAAQADALSTENADLLANLSFAAIPVASSTGTSTPAAETVSVSGTLAKSRATYALTTPYGVKVYVKNSADAAVAAALAPLADGTTTVTLAGTHAPGSAYLTVTAVNGSAIATGSQSQSQNQSPSSTQSQSP